MLHIYGGVEHVDVVVNVACLGCNPVVADVGVVEFVILASECNHVVGGCVSTVAGGIERTVVAFIVVVSPLFVVRRNEC